MAAAFDRCVTSTMGLKRSEGGAKTTLMSGAGQVGAPVRRLSLLFSIQRPVGGKPETRQKCEVALGTKSKHGVSSLERKTIYRGPPALACF